ncbi:MAG TPA: hypothetical protein VK718_00455 [Ferruginibacter sp.]|jgi:hypothetical protein|nr:hypothetical protein [Ferruginibacter sp.]
MITILTAPSAKPGYKISSFLKRNIKRYLLNKPIPKYSGHFAVTRSLLEGLKKIDISYNYNPSKKSHYAAHVHVLAGVETLRYAIKLKRSGKIKRLTAGPNIVIAATDFSGLICSPEIDQYLVNSEWTKKAYLLDAPILENRINYFPSGVDAHFWNITKKSTGQLHLLFYNKRPDPVLFDQCISIAEKYNAHISVLNYGSYTLDNFKQKLQETDFVIYFVDQESQGIAMFEIWATDTPTMHWNPGYWIHQQKKYESSSAPYLSDQTGRFFSDAAEFENLFIEKKLTVALYSPKKWIQQNGTDEICAQKFLTATKYKQ